MGPGYVIFAGDRARSKLLTVVYVTCVVGLMIAGGGCATPPPLRVECQADRECTLSNIAVDRGTCCSMPWRKPANTSSFAELEAWCRERWGDPGDSCPQIMETNRQPTAACVNHRCVEQRQ